MAFAVSFRGVATDLRRYRRQYEQARKDLIDGIQRPLPTRDCHSELLHRRNRADSFPQGKPITDRLPPTSHRNRLTPSVPKQHKQPSVPPYTEASVPLTNQKREEALPPPPSYSRCQMSMSLLSLSSLRPPSSTGAPPPYEENTFDSDDELKEDEFEAFSRVNNQASVRRCSAPFGLQEASTSGSNIKKPYRNRLNSDLV